METALSRGAVVQRPFEETALCRGAVGNRPLQRSCWKTPLGREADGNCPLQRSCWKPPSLEELLTRARERHPQADFSDFGTTSRGGPCIVKVEYWDGAKAAQGQQNGKMGFQPSGTGNKNSGARASNFYIKVAITIIFRPRRPLQLEWMEAQIERAGHTG